MPISLKLQEIACCHRQKSTQGVEYARFQNCCRCGKMLQDVARLNILRKWSLRAARPQPLNSASSITPKPAKSQVSKFYAMLVLAIAAETRYSCATWWQGYIHNVSTVPTRRSGNIMVCRSWSVSVCIYLLAGLGISWSVGPGVSVSVGIYSQVWECHGLLVRECQCLYLSTRRSGNIMVCWSGSVSVCIYLLAGLGMSWSVGPEVSVSVFIYSQVWEYHGLLVLECQCL